MRLSEREFAQLQSGKKAKPKAPKETDIQSAIREYLRWYGWFVIRHQQGIGSHKGLSDLTAIKAGRTVYVEVKTPKGVLSEDQEQFRADIESHGGTYIVARSVDDVRELCEARGGIMMLHIGRARRRRWAKCRMMLRKQLLNVNNFQEIMSQL